MRNCSELDSKCNLNIFSAAESVTIAPYRTVAYRTHT